MDFAGGLTPADRAGLEAALEASGLLDAWVGADGALVNPGTRDTFLRPGPELPDGPTLASALRPAPQPGCGVTSKQVEHLLTAIALAPAAETTARDAVHYDGSWRLGTLTGRHHKSDAEYVGAAVRAETRRRILAKLEERLTQTEQRLADARDELTEADTRRRSLRLAEQNSPGARARRRLERG